ncbi:MAG: tRNA (adenosine(37)-N6)-dimethylallyltransferase MiaA [Methylacidiphilales bacterium]|nr:tRNA (adenosine(37)-N6)-dimethylallyltransferase MiaA [Candidatus Methylacidiphilales bacterium]
MPPFLITGPTASGKSALALELAQCWGAAICSVDAFQIYRSMDIGTGKAPAAERAQVPHHLLDIAEPASPFSVADYLKAAKKVVKDVGDRQPLLWVGGTGLFVRALREGLSPAPESDPEQVKELSTWPLERLQTEIRKLDPVWCEHADLKNPRRIIRALAVVLHTGRPLSEWQQEKKPALLPYVGGIFLQPERELNLRQIAERVCKMWDSGWPEEVKTLLQIPGWRESQSAKAIGYLEIAEHLSGGIGREECLEKIILHTGQYAKRQMTWFRAEKNLKPIPYKSLEELTNLSRKMKDAPASFL